MSSRNCCCNPDPCKDFLGGGESYSLALASGVTVLVDQLSGGDSGPPGQHCCGRYKHFKFPLDATYLLDSDACAQGPVDTSGCQEKLCSPAAQPYRSWFFSDALPGTFTTEDCGPGGYFGGYINGQPTCPPDNCCPYPPCTSWSTPPDACLHGSFSLTAGCFNNTDPSLGPLGALARWDLRLNFYITNSGSGIFCPLPLPIDYGPCCWVNPIADPMPPQAAAFTFTGYGSITNGVPSLPGSWSGGGSSSLGWTGSCACNGPDLCHCASDPPEIITIPASAISIS